MGLILINTTLFDDAENKYYYNTSHSDKLTLLCDILANLWTVIDGFNAKCINVCNIDGTLRYIFDLENEYSHILGFYCMCNNHLAMLDVKE